MLHFKKISPQTLYAQLSQEELRSLGIDLERETQETKKRIMDMVSESLERQEELDIENPVSVRITVSDEGMKILVTEFQPHNASDIPMELWDQIVNEMSEEHHFQTDYMFAFQDFEDLLGLVASFPIELAETVLSHVYLYEDHYYFFIQFFQAEEEAEIIDLLSLVAEYGELATVTRHVLEEYGKVLIEDAAVEELYEHFFSRQIKSN